MRDETNTENSESARKEAHNPKASLSAVRRALADRGISDEAIKAMTPDQLRAEQANLRRRSEAPAPTQEEDLTGIKDATVTEERAMKGKAAVEHDLSRSNPEAFATAKRRIEKDPEYGQKLANEIVNKPRPHTQEEAMALALDRVRIHNEYTVARDQLTKALKDGNTSDQAYARTQMRLLEGQLETNDQAAEISGHETGAALQARRTMVKDDYSMPSIMTRAKQAKGDDLTDAERAQLDKRAQQLDEREKALAEREKQLQDQRREPRTKQQQTQAKYKFDSLSEQLKNIAQKDQMKPGCVV
jgi:hypothetical protein